MLTISAAWVGTLTLSCKHPVDPCPLSGLVLRIAMLAAVNDLSSHLVRPAMTPCASLKGVEFEAMDAGEWAHAVRCCCHACLAHLHRDGAAAFPEAVVQESAIPGFPERRVLEASQVHTCLG